jgi:hypothetical protein
MGCLTNGGRYTTTGYAVLERATRTRERDARRFHVRFDDRVSDWQGAHRAGLPRVGVDVVWLPHVGLCRGGCSRGALSPHVFVSVRIRDWG